MFNHSLTLELERGLRLQQEQTQPAIRPAGFRQRLTEEVFRPPAVELLVPDGWLGILIQGCRVVQRFQAGLHRLQAEELCELRLMPEGKQEATAGRTLWFADNRLLCIEQPGAATMPMLSGVRDGWPHKALQSRMNAGTGWQEEDPMQAFSFV